MLLISAAMCGIPMQMSYQILFISGAGNVTTQQEQVMIEGLKHKLSDEFRFTLAPVRDADNPTYQNWETALTRNLAELSDHVILLGHSFGASVILKHFSRTPVLEKVIGMLLFGVPYWKDQNWDVSDYAIEDEFLDNLAKLDNIYFYHSIDDEVIPNSQFKSYRKLIPNAHWRVLSAVDHSYHGAIPEMIEDIQDLADGVANRP